MTGIITVEQSEVEELGGVMLGKVLSSELTQHMSPKLVRLWYCIGERERR